MGWSSYGWSKPASLQKLITSSAPHTQAVTLVSSAVAFFPVATSTLASPFSILSLPVICAFWPDVSPAVPAHLEGSDIGVLYHMGTTVARHVSSCEVLCFPAVFRASQETAGSR